MARKVGRSKISSALTNQNEQVEDTKPRIDELNKIAPLQEVYVTGDDDPFANHSCLTCKNQGPRGK